MAGPEAPVLAVDLGSTSVKVGRFTLEGQVRGPIVSRRYRSEAPGVLDPAVVLAAVLDAIGEVESQGVEAVVLAALWQSVLRISPLGDPVGTALTWEKPWPHDRLDAMREALGDDWDGATSGAYLHPSYPLLLLAHESEQAHGERLVDLGSWVIEQLTGTWAGWSRPVAAGSGLWDQHSNRWGALVEHLGTRTQLDSAQYFDHPIRCSTPHPDLPTSLHAAQWMAPLPDGLCHNLGLGAVSQICAITVGTSGSVRSVQAWSPATKYGGLWRYRCGPETVAIGGAVSSAGNLLEWAAHFADSRLDWSFLNQDKPQLPTLTSRPDIFGRRGPDYPWDATGSLSGLRPHHTSHDVVRAVQIDMWATFADLFDRLNQTEPAQEIRAGGGVIERYPTTLQILADALARPVDWCAISQPVLRGAALVAAAQLREPRLDVGSAVDAVALRIRSGPSKPPVEQRIYPRANWTQALATRWGTSRLGQ